jgi:hypothetical protein
MTAYEEQPIDVWIELGDTTEMCDLGHVHPVTYWARKRLGPVVEQRQYSNGYQTMMTDVRQDRQGRTYHKHVQIDFFNNISWRRDSDGRLFWPRQPTGRDVVHKDVLDRVI